MGMPEQEIVVTSTVKEADDGHLTTETEAAQGDNRIIRNAEAELDTTQPEPRPDGLGRPERLLRRGVRLRYPMAHQMLQSASDGPGPPPTQPGRRPGWRRQR